MTFTIDQIGHASTTLFHIALIGYVLATVVLLYNSAYRRGEEVESATRAWSRRVGTGLVFAGFAAHLLSVIARAVAAGRYPLGNMYEYGSAMALCAVAFALVTIRHRWPPVMPFVLIGAVLMMASSILLYSDPEPLQPVLQSYWLHIHVSSMVMSSAIFIVAFVATALYLVKDHAEQVVSRTDVYSGSTVGAAHVETPEAELRTEVASRTAERDVMSPRWFVAVPLLTVGPFVALVRLNVMYGLAAGVLAGILGLAAWYSIPYLPNAASLDQLGYRTVMFGFPILTFGVIAGAIWAEASWGRYWGWDPKETGSFVTWILYASYLHARATTGWRGRKAAWVGVWAFISLMCTYYVVNLFIVGLHSYAGLD